MSVRDIERRYRASLKRRGFSPDFIANAVKKRKENLAAVAEGMAAELATETLCREQAITKAIADYNDAASRATKVEMKRRGMPEWAALIVLETAGKHGINPYFVAMPDRNASSVKARNEAIYRIKRTQPTLSAPQLGRWFDRDHTSILHSLAHHSEQTGEPRLTGYNLDLVRKRNAERKRYEARKMAREAA